MAEVIGVRFKSGGKQYYFDPKGVAVKLGQGVIIETSRGIEYGECTQGNTEVAEAEIVAPLRPLVRMATKEDRAIAAQNREKEARAFDICQQKVLDHGLDMKLVEVEYNFEGNKILFFFTSEGRVDFRALVKDLAAIFRARIELRQIGVRDEAKMLGGLGICGRPLCCSSFLDEFQPVSIKMAKTQNLSLNPTKISGTCGRLMCCLKYEQEAYEDLVKRCPKQESFVETPDGVGNVTNVSLLREQVKVNLDGSNEPPKSYHSSEIVVVRNGKGKRPDGYVAPPASELAKRRRVVPKEERVETVAQSPLSAAMAALLASEPAAPKPQQKGRGQNESGEKSGGGRNRQGNRKPFQGDKSSGKQQNQGKPNQGKQQNQPKQQNNGQQQGAGKQQAGSKPAKEGGENKPNPNRRRRWRPGGNKGPKKEG